MKKLIYILSILLFLLNFSVVYAYDTSEIVKTIPLDDGHTQIFTDSILKFINEKLVIKKEFDDGDALEQSLDNATLVRIDVLSSGIERYIVNLQLSVKRFVPNNALYTEEHLLQTVFFDVLNNELIDFHPFPAVDITQQYKLEL